MGTGRFGGDSSLHGGDDEFGALLDAGGPARGHRLGLGIEADRIRPVLVEVATKVVPDISLMDIFKGATPFPFTALAALAALCVFPGIVTWLASRLY
jgi:hypothetical protein